MTIFIYKGLTRNPEIRNNSAWVLPNMLLNAAKCQGYSVTAFTTSKLLVENQQGVVREVKKSLIPLPPPSPQTHPD